MVSNGNAVLPRGSARILVVDDEPDILSVLHQTLASLGHQVTCCRDGQEALDLLSATPADFDVLITDQAMPQLTGIELAKQVLELQPELPVILCTGYSDSLTEEIVQLAGITTLLYKPMLIEDLAQAVQRAIQGRKRNAALRRVRPGMPEPGVV